MRAQQRKVSEGRSARRDYRFRKVAVNVSLKVNLRATHRRKWRKVIDCQLDREKRF